MNREERRRTAKNGTFMGVLNDIKMANQFKAAIEGAWPIKEGDKVKLNLDAIMKHPGYQQQLPAYRKFCEENTETVFTVAYDERLRQSIVCLVEDKTEPKWLFWIGDLTKVS